MLLRPQVLYYTNLALLTITILGLITLSVVRQTKFVAVYKGIARDGLNACLNDPSFPFTRDNVTDRGNCRHALACIMDHIDNSQQSILSSGASTLGFVPTVLSLVDSSREDLMFIYKKVPSLAPLLSLAGVHIAGFKVAWGMQSVVQPTKTPPPHISTKRALSAGLPLMLIHLLAAGAAATMTWQTYDLGHKAVLSWGCWTNFYPLLSLALKTLQHILDILVLPVMSEHGRSRAAGWSCISVRIARIC